MHGIVRWIQRNAAQSISQTYIPYIVYFERNIEIARLGENGMEIEKNQPNLLRYFTMSKIIERYDTYYAVCTCRAYELSGFCYYYCYLCFMHVCVCAIKHKINVLRSLWLLSWTTGSATITIFTIHLIEKKQQQNKPKRSKIDGKRRKNKTNKCKTVQMIVDDSIACMHACMPLLYVCLLLLLLSSSCVCVCISISWTLFDLFSSGLLKLSFAISALYFPSCYTYNINTCIYFVYVLHTLFI